MNKNKKLLVLSAISGLVLALNGSFAVLAQSSSNNYKVEEVYFGTGGELESCSASYCSQQSSGSLTSGNASSANYDANSGFLTQSEPFLEMVVTGANVNFGTLNDATASSGAAQAGPCACSFYVRTYLSSEYVVVSVSQPPTSENGDSLDAKATLGVPSTNTAVEEFGINLVDNATPDIGKIATNQPDNSFADGKAETGYDVPNQFKYGAGDIIARSQATLGNPAIGLTEYTISYIAKPSINTPAGNYVMNHDLVVVATF